MEQVPGPRVDLGRRPPGVDLRRRLPVLSGSFEDRGLMMKMKANDVGWPTFDGKFMNYPKFKHEWRAYQQTLVGMTWWPRSLGKSA